MWHELNVVIVMRWSWWCNSQHLMVWESGSEHQAESLEQRTQAGQCPHLKNEANPHLGGLLWGLNEMIAVECSVQHWMKRELCFCLACLRAVMTCQVSTIGKSQFLKVNLPPSNLLNWWTYWGMLFNNRKDWATSRGKSMNDSQSHMHFEARHKRLHAMWFPLYSFPVVVQSISHIQLFVTPWTATCQAPHPSLSHRVFSNSCLLSQWCCLSNSV